jgi:hypothetical protein
MAERYKKNSAIYTNQSMAQRRETSWHLGFGIFIAPSSMVEI